MAKKKKTGGLTSYPKPGRLSFSEDEITIEWLPMLLDAFYAADFGVYESIDKEISKNGRNLACAKGCSTCCTTHITIPVYPLELLGIYWYVIGKIHGAKRELIYSQLHDYTLGKGCPFLAEGACGIHPMRPMACRHFNVFGKPCEEDEDPFYSRRNDVLTPIEKYKEKALSLMLPYHGIKQRPERREAMRNGYIHQFARNLQEVDWPKLAIRMKAVD